MNNHGSPQEGGKGVRRRGVRGDIENLQNVGITFKKFAFLTPRKVISYTLSLLENIPPPENFCADAHADNIV